MVWENAGAERLAQEIVLGVGGVRALQALGLEVDGYHYNDGHPAFAGLELISQRMKKLREENVALSEEESFKRAWYYVKARTAFTSHTNVPAGNESHFIDLMMEVGANVGLTRAQLEKLGGNPFGMTVVSLRLASMCNGVSRLQVVAARDMWKWVKPAPNMIAITNGVHAGTWWNEKIRNAYINNDIYGIVKEHDECKSELIKFIYEKTGVEFKHNRIIIAFARRATEYKRWNLIFREKELLEELIKKYGIQLVFTGKAHHHDKGGKSYISEICGFSKKYPNNVIFLEGYDISVAQKLVAGADVWLNNPRVPLEACGTSGMKAAQYGVNGFNIGNGEYGAPDQDAKDAKALMEVLKKEVLLTYQHDEDTWANMMYASIATSQQYSMARMVEEYHINMYNYLGE